MKTKLFVFLTAFFIFQSCSTEKWPKEKTDILLNSCIEAGKNNPSLSEQEVYKYCDCILERIKQKFKDYKDAEKNYPLLSKDEKIKMVDKCLERLKFDY